MDRSYPRLRRQKNVKLKSSGLGGATHILMVVFFVRNAKCDPRTRFQRSKSDENKNENNAEILRNGVKVAIFFKTISLGPFQYIIFEACTKTQQLVMKCKIKILNSQLGMSFQVISLKEIHFLTPNYILPKTA